MRFAPVNTVLTLAASFASKVHSLAAVTPANPCPTVTSTSTYCSTCIRPFCLVESTITRQVGCAAAIPTVYTGYPCYGPCPGGCGTTYVTKESDETTAPPFVSSSSCVPTVTVTTRPGISGGCAFNCSGDFCIIDNFVTLPCGCSQAAGVVTKTITACATSSPCWNCHTGFPFTTTATDCPEPIRKM
ncbi:hypothetical protein V8C37DRAFT_371238 [Trichoderma ceciliae]